MIRGPEGRTPNVSPARKGWGINPEENPSAVGAALCHPERTRISCYAAPDKSACQGAYSYAVNYDGNGNATGYNDSVAGNWTVKNDALHRFLSSAGTFNGVASSFQETYGHFGNRNVEYFTYKGTQNQPSPYLNFTTANNQVATWSYDKAGNLLSDETNNHLYDAENRLCAVQQNPPLSAMIGYLYAPDGTRLGKGKLTRFSCDLTKNGMLTANGLALTNAYVVGPQGEELEETDGNFNLLHFNVFWEGKPLGTFAGTTYAQSNWRFTLHDWLGTARQVTNSAGATSTSFFDGPFGDYQPQSSTGSDPSGFHFTGKERDIESNLDYFGARYYNSNLGRFLSPDFNGDDDYSSPVPYADLSNPQTLNLYGYAGKNPLTNVDPDGHDCIYFSGSGDASVKSGDCYSDTDNGIYVNGTLNSLSYNSANSSLGFSYTAYDTGNIGTGVIAGAPAPGSGPEMDEGGATDQSGGLLATIAGVSGAYQAFRTLTSAVCAARSAPGRTPPDVNNLSPKIVRQMGTRGWTKDEISETVRNGEPHDVTNKATGGPAVEYVNPANGKFVVIDKTTNQVLQVSGPAFPQIT